MSVRTDIRTGLPVMADTQQQADEVRAAAEKAARMGISETPQALALRQIVFEHMVHRINILLVHDDVLAAMQSVLRRLEMSEVVAEEAARRLMVIRPRDEQR